MLGSARMGADFPAHHPRAGPFPFDPVGGERSLRKNEDEMLYTFDCAKHLRSNIFATFDALQVAPGSDASFVFKPFFEFLGEHAAICPGIGDEDHLRQELLCCAIAHLAPSRNCISWFTPRLVGVMLLHTLAVREWRRRGRGRFLGRPLSRWPCRYRRRDQSAQLYALP